ncbi:MAG TPA: hemerythrin domain-containing protein [Propionibacteriaceae bacterium]|nr:hemerythrin domain-containing protein [Propionibacteriaceae bacterium]
MSMNKTIHRAVRRDLARFRGALDVFVDGDGERAAALHRAWENLDDQLTEHHLGEHAIAWPALNAIGIAGSTIDTFDVEHEAMAADLAAAGDAMAKLRSSASRSDADQAAAAMERLQLTTVIHLDHEEAETEVPLTQKASDPAVKKMSEQYSRRSGPVKAGTFLAWMQDGATPEEMSALRAHVPGPVLRLIGGLLGRRYRKEVATVWRGQAERP